MDSGVVIAVIIWVAVAIIARLNIPIISPILRWWWNISFTIAAYIPFCGWMSIFIITKGDEKAKKRKEELVNIGRSTDDMAFNSLEQSAKREEAEREVRAAQQKAEREALEEDLKGRAYRALGTRNVTLNSDGSMAKVGDGDFVPVNELKKELR
ncbi:MAG: hypothetical protein IJN96_04705 [Clostridia bacterium]|nr:hypothetical protein [Clostridia bacterium]